MKAKMFSIAEGDVGALSRRLQLLEEEVDRSERHLGTATADLANTSQRADQSIKKRQQFESINCVNEDTCDKLEWQLKEDRCLYILFPSTTIRNWSA